MDHSFVAGASCSSLVIAIVLLIPARAMKSSRLSVFAVTLVVAVGISRTMLVSSSPVVNRRQGRSFWPFAGTSVVSSEPTEQLLAAQEPGLTGSFPDHAVIAPDDGRIWKIHKYQGFELRPVDPLPGDRPIGGGAFVDSAHSAAAGASSLHLDTELNGYPIYPPLDQDQNDVVSVVADRPQNNPPQSYSNHHQMSASQSHVEQGFSGTTGNLESQQDIRSGYSDNHPFYPSVGGNGNGNGNYEGTTEPIDLSFLDDLGGLAYFLPEPQDDEDKRADQFHAETSSVATVEQESSNSSSSNEQPGFLQSLLHKLSFGMLGSAASGAEVSTAAAGYSQSVQQTTTAAVAPTYHLPEAQGSYIAYRLPAQIPPAAAAAAAAAGVSFAAVPNASQQEAVHSQDAQSTSYVFGDNSGSDGGELSFSDFSSATNESLINPRGHQNTAGSLPEGATVVDTSVPLYQKLPALHYGPLQFAPENSRGSEAATAVPPGNYQPALHFSNSAAVDAADAEAGQFDPSEFSLINLSPPLPHRAHTDFGRDSASSERRVGEHRDESEKDENFTEERENTTTPAALLIVTPDAEFTKTYARTSSYGAAAVAGGDNSTR